MTRPSILVLAGSTRSGSLNRRLALATVPMLERAGAEATWLDLREHPMPIYDGDIEAARGLPPGAAEVKRLMLAHDGFLIASPEHNSSFSALLKNTIDWCSRRSEGGEKPLAAFRGKTAALVAAAPGKMGGLRGLLHLRWVLANIGVHVVPDQLAMANAAETLGEDGRIEDEAQREALNKVVAALARTTAALKGASA